MTPPETFFRVTNAMIYAEIKSLESKMERQARKHSILATIVSIGFAVGGAALYILFSQ